MIDGKNMELIRPNPIAKVEGQFYVGYQDGQNYAAARLRLGLKAGWIAQETGKNGIELATFEGHSRVLPYYLETQAHWRNLDDFKPLAPVFFFGKLVIAASFAALYLFARRSGSLREGIAIGAIVGALFAGRYMITFATENLFTIEILLSWIAAYALLEHAGCGAIASKVYR